MIAKSTFIGKSWKNVLLYSLIGLFLGGGLVLLLPKTAAAAVIYDFSAPPGTNIVFGANWGLHDSSFKPLYSWNSTAYGSACMQVPASEVGVTQQIRFRVPDTGIDKFQFTYTAAGSGRQ